MLSLSTDKPKTCYSVFDATDIDKTNIKLKNWRYYFESIRVFQVFSRDRIIFTIFITKLSNMLGSVIE